MEKDKNEFEQKMSKILYFDLALENYEDLTGNRLEELDENFEKLKLLRQNRNFWSEDVRLREANNILDNFNKIIEDIGTNNFTFYDNGAVEYTGPNLVSKKKKESEKKYE